MAAGEGGEGGAVAGFLLQPFGTSSARETSGGEKVQKYFKRPK